MNYFIRHLRSLLWTLCAALLCTACTQHDDLEIDAGYGYLQFNLFKSASYTRAGSLDFLHDATKIRVTLRSSSGAILNPTVSVSVPDKNSSEYGMQSDKLKLEADNYQLVAYQVFDALDQPVVSQEIAPAQEILVIADGVVTHDLLIDVAERGWVNFRLVKDLSQLPDTRAGGADAYPFLDISYVDVTVRNTQTGETSEFTAIPVTYRNQDVADDQNGEIRRTGIGMTDSLLLFRAGTYEVTYFRTYFDYKRTVYETNLSPARNRFTVADNQQTVAEIPVTLNAKSDYIQDAMALREIWEALDGPNWRVKWNFDKDVDMWGIQPGVTLYNGRVSVLNFENLGARGDMPDAIGQLSELRALICGTHSYDPASSVTSPSQPLIELAHTDREKFRRSFTEMYVDNSHPLSIFPKEMHSTLGVPESSGIELRSVPSPDPNTYSNYITSLPDAINKCQKLQTLYFGYGGIQRLPEDMSALTALTDVEFFACPDLTEFPTGLTTLPMLSALIFSGNGNVPPQSLYDGLKKLDANCRAGIAATRLQGLYLLQQRLDRVPDISGLTYLSILNIQQCGVNAFDAPFGKDHPFVAFYAGGNNLSELPVDEYGFFIGQDSQTETVEFASNKFTELPDIFDASEGVGMGTVNFAGNKIERIGTFNGGEYRGMNAEIINLSKNRLTKFPVELAKSHSMVMYLQLQANQIEEVEPEALEGDSFYALTSLDLSSNKLKSLPYEFNVLRLPSLMALDLSFNRFANFPYTAVNNQNMRVFLFRHQRDEEGNRCMREWPTGIGGGLGNLRGLYLGSNDIRTVNDTLSYMIYTLDISDNPNIVIDVSAVCPYIGIGYYELIYSPDQDIRGCDQYLNLDK